MSISGIINLCSFEIIKASNSINSSNESQTQNKEEFVKTAEIVAFESEE